MTPFYSTDERIAALLAEAATWIGTPFKTNHRAKGRSVDCHNLLYALHRATEALPEFEIPRGRSGIAGQLQVRRMSDFFATRPEFADVTGQEPIIGDILTGKTIGGEYHMGMFLGTINNQPKTCISALHDGVKYVNLFDPTWSEPIIANWRVIEA